MFIYKRPWIRRHLFAELQAMDDGATPQPLHVLLGLVQVGLLHHLGGRPLYQLDKIMTINFVHDAKHPTAVIADPLQVLAFARVGLSFRWGEGEIKG